jgi:hypothetical protein
MSVCTAISDGRLACQFKFVHDLRVAAEQGNVGRLPGNDQHCVLYERRLGNYIIHVNIKMFSTCLSQDFVQVISQNLVMSFNDVCVRSLRFEAEAEPPFLGPHCSGLGGQRALLIGHQSAHRPEQPDPALCYGLQQRLRSSIR